MDFGKIAIYAVPTDGSSLDAVEKGMDAVLAEVIKNGVTEAELDRAKKAYLAEHIYESDNQATLARRYGWGLVVGRTVAEIDAWPEKIAAVTLDDVKKVAGRYLDARRSVTGTLLPVAADADSKATAASPSGRS
jgi:zinc protease